MPELKPRKLGISRDTDPVRWVLAQTGTLLVYEWFTVSFYRECLNMAEAAGPLHRPNLEAVHAIHQFPGLDINRQIVWLEETSSWAGKVRQEDYHTVNTHVFITLWAAQEAGVENLVSEIIRTNLDAAKIAGARLPKANLLIDDWAWSESVCLDAFKRLERQAISATANGGDNVAQRVGTLLSWFDLNVNIDAEHARTYNEASMVRNVMMHRYGHLEADDIERFPELAEWAGAVLPIASARVSSYYAAILAMHQSISRAATSSNYK